MTDPANSKELVLLVDDDAFLLDMYAMKFKQCGLPIEAISSPLTALERLRAGLKPTIVMLDVIMPGLSGFEFLEAVRKEGLAPGARVIMLSNQGQQEDIDKATALGADGYIIKASAIPSEVCDKALAISRGKK